MFDPYQVLGLKRDATEKQIKSAYRTVSLRHHPDNGGNAELFEQCSRAKDILLDPETRDAYDTRGWEYLQRVEEERRNIEQYERERNLRKCRETFIDIDVTLAQIFRKDKVNISCKVPILDARGNRVSEKEFKGELPATTGACGIPLQGTERPNHINGDIVVRFHVEDDDYEVQDLHLVREVKLGLGELIDGYCINLVHPNTKIYTIQGKYVDEDVLIFKGLGIERGKDIGDLIVKFIIDLRVAPEQRGAILQALGYRKPQPSGEPINGMTVRQMQEERARQMQGMRIPFGFPPGFHVSEGGPQCAQQ